MGKLKAFYMKSPAFLGEQTESKKQKHLKVMCVCMFDLDPFNRSLDRVGRRL